MALSVSVLNIPIVVISNYLIHTHKHTCINKFVDRYIGFRNTLLCECFLQESMLRHQNRRLLQGETAALVCP